MMYIGFPILSLFYVVFFLINYYSKERINLLENKVVSSLMIANAVGLLLELGCYAVLVFLKVQEDPVGMLILKSYIFYMYVFDWILTGYICLLTDKRYVTENFDKKAAINKSLLIFSPVVIVGFFITFFTKLNYYNVYPKYYTYGLSTDFLIYFTIVLAPFWIYRCIVTTLKRKSKEYTIKLGTILLGILFVGISGALMQFVDRSMLIITSAHTLMLVLIYFTIENPDMKMLDEVHKAKEITDNANEEKELFLYNMTNEIREITKDIEYSADAILDETDNKKVNIENVNNNARDIKASAARFTTMTNEILDISSMDTANIKIYNDRYNVKLIIKELVQVYKSKAEKKGLKFRTTIASDLPEYLYGDAVGVKTSLNTILDNSIKHTESGYIEFDVNAIIKNSIARLIISIEDSGTGMKAENLGKIFNKQEEDKESTNLSNNLYNAKKLITLMGGTIIPSSIYGKGTVIKVVLDQKVAESSDNLEKYEKALDKKRILLVDDNQASIKMITKLLKDSNTILESISSGKECLDKIRSKEKYDLILLDEDMSPLDGKAVMKKLQEIRNFNINVILLTKNNDYEYNEDYLKYGFKDYLVKPVDKDKLLEKISKYSK